MKNSKKMNKTWMQFKVSTLSASITALILSGIPYQVSASDIDIYQAGGNGPVMIYLMLDTSGSMNGDSFMQTDYGFPYLTKIENTTEEICRNDVYYENVTAKTGDYNWVDGTGFVEVGANKGNFLKKTKTSRNCTDITYKKAITKELCNSTEVTNNLKVNSGYTYTKSGTDLYCKVDFNETAAVTADYKQKIINTCDAVSSTTYNCYSRIVKLRQGLLNLINDSSIDDKVSFALGEYPLKSDTNKANLILDFIQMNVDNKKKISDKIVALVAGGGTPISPAYGTAATKLLSNISSTVSSGASLECTGKGVYFLTDGEPSTGNGQGDFSTILSNNSITAKNSKSLASGYWDNIQKFAESLKESKYKIKTATVGFGGEYYLPVSAGAEVSNEGKAYYDCSKLSGNQQQLCQWGAKKIPKTGYESIGGLGEGGFYNAQSAAELLKSVKSFMNEVTPPIEGTTMGSSTIPVDALNTSELQPYAYFPMFKPLIGTEDQLWMGNLKKFNVTNGSLFDVKRTAVFKNASDFNAKLQDYWYTAEGKNSDDFLAFGGNLSQLQAKMKVLSENNTVKLKRNLLMNINGALVPVSTLMADQTLSDREYLYGLLGYSKLTSQNLIDLKAKTSYEDQLTYLNTLGTPKNDYQLGAVIHSSPLLLTQKGVVEYGVNGFTSTDREDYILYGTTQGVLHVLKAGQQSKQSLNGTGIDASGGEEVFAFVPKEMLTKQKTGFIESLAQKRSKTIGEGGGFFYGVDGQWSAHTEYEASIYETAKLDSDGNKVLDADKKEIMLQREGLQVKPKSDLSHQYVYGGLRMGGRSYYGLNLSDISKPQMLFHINPDENTTGPLSYMGQSWSKPTLTYIKWNGAKKLAMIVGGGYDEKYETATYKKADTDIVKGNGIYIFDAKNGDLLWWGSSFAKDGNAALNADKTRVETPASSNIAAMTNSIPSRIKAVDRNGDGISDHLYVGDLGGQVFRIDISADHTIDKDLTKAKKFTINAFKFADLNTAGKNSPRFYEAPTFTIHKKDGANFAVVTLISGDRSSPLVTNDANSQDMIVGLYDNGVTEPVPVAKTAAALTNLQQIYLSGATAVKDAKGWFYKLPITGNTTTKYQSRGLAEGIALDNDLYYSIFNPQKSASSTGSATSCTGGIIGDSTAYKLCLPYGICTGATDITKVGGLGAGIIALSVGPGTDSNSRTLILNDALNSGPQYGTKDRLLPRRWFEYSPYVGK